jgi:hypothetical protein
LAGHKAVKIIGRAKATAKIKLLPKLKTLRIIGRA